jgi:rhodanese-related sulfurtransferase
MEIESLYVGRPPGVENIPWYEYPELTPDPAAFVAAVEREAQSKQQSVLLICRSGKRTVDAGLALEAAGFTDVAHVVHGFEGELNDAFKRFKDVADRKKGSVVWTPVKGVGNAQVGGSWSIAKAKKGTAITLKTQGTVEVPLGILTSLIGAPFFALVLARTRRQWF